MIGEDEASTPPREMWHTGGIAMETSIQLRACGLFGNKMGELACEAPTNDAAVPEGEYLSSCGGCLLKAGGALSCTHCRVASPKAAHFRPKQAPTNSIDAAECPAGQTVHNIDGQLACAEQRQQERQDQEQQDQDQEQEQQQQQQQEQQQQAVMIWLAGAQAGVAKNGSWARLHHIVCTGFTMRPVAMYWLIRSALVAHPSEANYFYDSTV